MNTTGNLCLEADLFASWSHFRESRPAYCASTAVDDDDVVVMKEKRKAEWIYDIQRIPTWNPNELTSTHCLPPSDSSITLSKMRASGVLAASASLFSLAHARIFGVGIPSAIKPGDTFDLIIEAQNYIQSVTDVAIAVGYSLGGAPAADGLGIFITAFDLGNVEP
jgi:hypothetical protein